MARTTFRSFTKNLDVTDLRWMPGEGFSPSRLRIELLSGLTVALALLRRTRPTTRQFPDGDLKVG